MTLKTREILKHCRERRVRGAVRYGHLSFIDYDNFKEATEELIDFINYLFFELIKKDDKGDDDYEARIEWHTTRAMGGDIPSDEFEERIYELIRQTVYLLKEVDLLSTFNKRGDDTADNPITQ